MQYNDTIRQYSGNICCKCIIDGLTETLNLTGEANFSKTQKHFMESLMDLSINIFYIFTIYY